VTKRGPRLDAVVVAIRGEERYVVVGMPFEGENLEAGMRREMGHGRFIESIERANMRLLLLSLVVAAPLEAETKRVNEDGDTIEAVTHWRGGIHSTRRVRKNTTGHRCVGAEKTAEILAQMAGRFSEEDIRL
jgi:hypothetical protein